MRTTLLLLSACFLFVACGNTTSEEKDLLTRADIVINTHPDSAWHLLKKITKPEKLASADQALYALLMSQEMDRRGESATSDSLIRIAINYYSHTDEAGRTGYAYLYLSRIEHSMGNPKGQADALFKAIPFAIESNDDKLLGYVYGEKATIYETQQDNDLNEEKSSAYDLQQQDSMLHYHQLSLRHFQKAGDKHNSTIGLIDIGYSYYLHHQYDSALYYCKKAEHEAATLHEPMLLSTIYRLTEGIYYYKKNYLKALHYIRLSMQTSDPYDYSKWKLISMIYLQTGELDSATYYMNKWIATGNELPDCYQLFQELAEKRGQPAEALRYAKLATAAKDSADHRMRAEAFAGMERKYNYERINVENKELIIHNQRYIIGLILVLLFSAIVLYFSTIEQKHQRKMTRLEDDLRKTVEAKDKFFTIISHDLRNPVKALNRVSDSLSEQYSELTEQEKINAIHAINDTARQADKLLENLLLWAMSQKIDIPYRPHSIQLSEMVKTVINLFSLTAEKKDIRLLNEIAATLYIKADSDMMSTILGNLISNAIKFSYQGGEVTIRAAVTGHFAEISVSDHGTGISSEDQQLLFRIDTKLKQNGTQNESGSGLGLILCNEFIKKQGGKIRVESEPGKGSTFSFTVLKSNHHEAS